jgi:hypothetical protein
MTGLETASASAPSRQQSGTLDEMMLAMDVVDTLRHRDVLVERELAEESREQQLVDRLRALYKGQGIDVPDSIIAQGVKALKDSRFVYTPAKPSLARTVALMWVRRGRYAGWTGVGLAACLFGLGYYEVGVVRPREQAAEASRIELAETLPRQLTAAHSSVRAEALDDDVRRRADAVLAQGRSALDRGNATDARGAVSELDNLSVQLRLEYVLRIAGRPEDQTGFYREHPSFRGRAYFLVVDAIDPGGRPVELPIRNDETDKTESVSRFAVRVPGATFNAVRDDKARNGIVQNVRLGDKRRGVLEPTFRMPVLEGRVTRW